MILTSSFLALGERDAVVDCSFSLLTNQSPSFPIGPQQRCLLTSIIFADVSICKRSGEGWAPSVWLFLAFSQRKSVSLDDKLV